MTHRLEFNLVFPYTAHVHNVDLLELLPEHAPLKLKKPYMDVIVSSN